MITLEDELKEAKQEIKKWKAKTADFALAISLLRDTEIEMTTGDDESQENFMVTRWIPGLKLLGITK